MGKYSGELVLIDGSKIVLDEGCQFLSETLERRKIVCGQLTHLDPSEVKTCQGCLNYYYVHEIPQTLVRSEYSSFETY